MAIHVVSSKTEEVVVFVQSSDGVDLKVVFFPDHFKTSVALKGIELLLHLIQIEMPEPRQIVEEP